MQAHLEHTNVTVADTDATAKWMCSLFDWHVRWEGASSLGGRSVHVGTDTHYIALYSPDAPQPSKESSYGIIGGLNHIAVTVADIDAMETEVKAHGFTPEKHADYEPGRRFYFHDHDGIEYEIVSYP